MTIILNNREEIFSGETMTITEIMEAKSFIFKMLVIKLNGSLISKDLYSTTNVTNGDKLDIIHLVSGG
jgi:sulfur carrier protein